MGAARTVKVEPAAWRRASANARPARVRLEQPLLFVGLGGTGRQVATRVKAAFIERFGHVPENAILLAFDSAEDPVSVREGRHGSVVTLEVGSQFFQLDRVPLAGIRRTPERHPDVVERLGDSLNRMRRASIQDGAAGERTQGLLSLIWNVQMVVRQIELVIRRLMERSDDLRHDAGQAQRPQRGHRRIGVRRPEQRRHDRSDVYGARGAAGRGRTRREQPRARPGRAARRVPGVRGPNFEANTHAFSVELDRLQAGRRLPGLLSGRHPGRQQGTAVRRGLRVRRGRRARQDLCEPRGGVRVGGAGDRAAAEHRRRRPGDLHRGQRRGRAAGHQPGRARHLPRHGRASHHPLPGRRHGGPLHRPPGR